MLMIIKYVREYYVCVKRKTIKLFLSQNSSIYFWKFEDFCNSSRNVQNDEGAPHLFNPQSILVHSDIHFMLFA